MAPKLLPVLKDVNMHSLAAKSLQSCPTLCDPIDGSPRPWDSPGKNTGVGCHFLLQCMKVKSESEAAQSCPTLSDPMDCSLPGSSIHGIFQARVLEWGAIAFSEYKVIPWGWVPTLPHNKNPRSQVTWATVWIHFFFFFGFFTHIGPSESFLKAL